MVDPDAVEPFSTRRDGVEVPPPGAPAALGRRASRTPRAGASAEHGDQQRPTTASLRASPTKRWRKTYRIAEFTPRCWTGLDQAESELSVSHLLGATAVAPRRTAPPAGLAGGRVRPGVQLRHCRPRTKQTMAHVP